MRIRVGIDFDISPRMAGALDALYGHRGFEFIHMQKLVPGPTDDEIWADVFTRYGGRVVLSGNSKIAYKPHQAVAFIDNGLISFFPDSEWNRLPAHSRNAVLIEAWPRIEEKVADQVGGSCWRIQFGFTNGELKLSQQALKPLEIPDDVLKAARSQKAGAAAGEK